ncbi:YbaB/EbfC family nucleoid-associated protein [Candidatus Poribacteria bacterium]|jgi:DNA-binding YbaB/EbfC family protein|nr:YbaB/EbfC family nucleoid-associated protein [Candidatus Poribacteria bacterium]|tara:strand:- start:622 stop:930 length:309 start_codon:yes stop_codon:yes gene_type:complete
MNMNNLMKQAQKMQKRMVEMQEEMTNRTVEASVGGGMVAAVANGSGELVSIKLSPEVVDPDDIEMLEDLIVAAVSEAHHKSQELMSEEMSKLTGGVKIPGMM